MLFKGLFKNLGLKFFSLLLALALWFFVTSQVKSEIGFTIPLEFRNPPPATAVVQSSEGQVNVRLRGSTSVVKRLSPKQIQAFIDLRKAVEGENLFIIEPNQFEIPKGLEITNVSPANVRVVLEKTANKRLVVTPTFRGQLPAGLEIKRVVMKPQTVLVQATRSVIGELREAETEPIELADITDSTEIRVRLKPFPINIKPLDQVDFIASIVVNRGVLRKVFRNIEIKLGDDTQKKIQLKPSRVDVEVEGPAEVIRNLRKAVISATLELGDLAQGIYQKPVKVILPSGVGLVKVTPKALTVRVLGRSVRPPASF